MATKTRKTSKTTKATRKGSSRKVRSILGLPIEGADHSIARTEITDLINDFGPDTEGEALPEIDPKLTEKQQKAKDKKALQTLKAPKQAKATTYAGEPIPATKVYRRDMPEFKNCQAECWMLVNGETSYTFANTYNGNLKASYNAKHYTYALTPKSHKKVLAKAEQMIEVEVTDWPAWIVNAAPKRTRKAK